MTREDLLAWKDNPATQWVLEALSKAAQVQQDGWMEMTWIQRQCDPLTLTELVTRADAYLAIRDASYEDFCTMRGEEVEE